MATICVCVSHACLGLVWFLQGYLFYFNQATRQSVWELPVTAVVVPSNEAQANAAAGVGVFAGAAAHLSSQGEGDDNDRPSFDDVVIVHDLPSRHLLDSRQASSSLIDLEMAMMPNGFPAMDRPPAPSLPL